MLWASCHAKNCDISGFGALETKVWPRHKEKQSICSLSLQSTPDTSANLIELDSSLTLEVDDFDPLNQNARRMPPVQKSRSAVLASVPSTIPSPNAYHRVAAFSNPVYPYHQLPVGQQKGLVQQSTTPSPVPSNYKEDENELLRKYGLDRLNLGETKQPTNSNENTPDPFALRSSNRTSNRTVDPFLDNTSINGDIHQKTNNNWTTFD